MKRIRMTLVTIAVMVLASGCAARVPHTPTASSIPEAEAAPARHQARTAKPVDQISVDDGSGNKILIQRVEFQLGTSSVSVERLAKKYGCEGGAGAGLITNSGPLEMYRMNCDNGQVFLARCELRQCQPLP